MEGDGPWSQWRQEIEVDGRTYTVSIVLDYLPHQGGRRIDARKITVEMKDPLRAADWRKILPIPLIHEAIAAQAREIAQTTWPGETPLALVSDASGVRPPTPADEADFRPGMKEFHTSQAAAMAAELTPAKLADRAAIADSERRRQLVAALHNEALEHNEVAPRRYVIERLREDHGIDVSAATVTRDIRAAVRSGETRPSITRGGTK